MLEEIRKTLPDVKKAVCVLSGGLDSSIVTYLAVNRYGADNVSALTFYYRQKQGDAEIFCAKRSCTRLGIKHQLVDITFLGNMVAGVSANITGTDVEMPTIRDVLGQPQPVTYVPYRNMILNSIAFSFAEAKDASAIFSGLQSHDCYGYWDTTPEFIEAMNKVSTLNRMHNIQMYAPFVELAKVDEIRLGLELDVHFEETFTCYNPRQEVLTRFAYGSIMDQEYTPYLQHAPIACGKCPSCAERIMNFAKAGVADPVPYDIKLDWSELIDQYRE